MTATATATVTTTPLAGGAGPPGKLGYIRIATFSKATEERVRQALGELKAHGGWGAYGGGGEAWCGGCIWMGRQEMDVCGSERRRGALGERRRRADL